MDGDLAKPAALLHCLRAQRCVAGGDGKRPTALAVAWTKRASPAAGAHWA